MSKKNNKPKKFYGPVVENTKYEVAPELQRYNHENMNVPNLTFKDRRG